MKCKYPENDANEIAPKLWLGNLKSSCDSNFLKKNKISIVIRFLSKKDVDVNNFNPKKIKNLPFDVYTYFINNVKYIHFVVKDRKLNKHQCDRLFETTLNLLTRMYNKYNILVHCIAGHHRSASVVCYFLINYFNFGYEDAIKHVNSIRNCAMRRHTKLSKHLFILFSKKRGITRINPKGSSKGKYYIYS